MSSKHRYTHLSPDQRDLLAHYRSQGLSVRAIAAKLQRSPSTISRELHRNGGPVRKCYYGSHAAQLRAATRKRLASKHKRLRDPVVMEYVKSKLKPQLRWSPEQIAGRLRLDIPGKRISHEAIYQWIYADALHLARFLPKAHRKRRYRGYVKRKHLKQHIPDRVPITARPSSVEARRVAGHWEADTVGNRKSDAVLLVIHERKMRFTILRKLSRRTAQQFYRQSVRALRALPASLRKTITYDNGPENALHARINRALSTRSYFCAPYHSWEKGSVENSIGVFRLYCPKSRSIRRLSHDQVAAMEAALNGRPRRCLGYRTPAELLSAYLRRSHVAKRRSRAMLQPSGKTDSGPAGEQPGEG
jgi:IS30 family transposase